MSILVKLSKLEASRTNPRQVKPERDAHRRLVASIRAHGLIEPLVVQAVAKGTYRVIAGNRRLAALRDVHRGHDAEIPCVLREAGDAESLSLAENFVREPMHPLDEAEAFARLASVDRKGVAAIASEFGVRQHYVRQRIALSDLCGSVKAAFRRNEIGVGVAEAFASVPAARQEALWYELGGRPHSAEDVRARIEQEWIPAEHALFDLGVIEPSQISYDLFGGTTLIAREAFMRAQRAALDAERLRLLDEGWSAAIVTQRNELPDLYRTMMHAEGEYDGETTTALAELDQQRKALEQAMDGSDEDEARARELDDVDAEESMLVARATVSYSEATKAQGTVYLILDADGRVERQYRVPRAKDHKEAATRPDQPLTSDDLSDAQLAELRTHELLAVREALMDDPCARKRLLIMALHDNVGREAIMVRTHATGADLHADTSGEFRSAMREAQIQRRAEVDPFVNLTTLSEVGMYERLKDLSEPELDALLATLTVRILTNRLESRSPLIGVLMSDLRINLRDHWTPDERWLNRYTKPQLAHLLVTLQESNETADLQRSETDSPSTAPTPSATTTDAWLQHKKSELVSTAAALFKPKQPEATTTEPPHLTNQAVAVTEAVDIAEPPSRTTTRAATWLPKPAKLPN